jgi:hypothetical protein
VGGLVTFAGNQFGSNVGTKAMNSVKIVSNTMTWVFKESTFSKYVGGPSCSLPASTKAANITHVLLDGVTFDSLNGTSVVLATNNCNVVLAKVTVVNSDSNSPALLTCNGASMSVSDSVFADDATGAYPLSSCTNCKFLSTDNDVTAVSNVGTCKW